MIGSMHSQTHLLLPLLLLSLGLISCAQSQKQKGNIAPDRQFDLWQQEKLLQTDTKFANSEPVKIARSAKYFFSGLTLAEVERVRMEAWNAYRGDWQTIAKRSRYVRQPMLDTLVKMGAPEELQMIPVVESSYDPYAQSEVGATGLWQLMPSAAQDMRIKSNRFIDGRREITVSTRGAAKLLLKHYKRFGNWPLAFAAYHLGARGVQKRLNRRPWQPEDGLKRIPLPPITKTYVRHILGLISLYQIGEFAFPKPFLTETIRVHAPVNLDVLHEKAELPKDQLFRFNPKLNLKHYYEKKSSNISLRVSRWRVPAVRKHIPAKSQDYMTIAIRKGESLKDIKKRYKTTFRKLYKANPESLAQIARSGTLRIPLKVLRQAEAGKNPLVKPPVHMLADNSNMGL